jgi:CheY-like chemotaxis protein
MNANKENLKLNMELRQANEAKTLFLTNMSHELRTPLNALLGLTDVLLRSDLNVQDRKHLMVQEKMARHLLNTLNNVLDYSRMEAQELQIESKSFDLRAVIDQVCSEIKSQTDSKMNQFFCEIADDLPKWVRGDDERLSQVLLNILDNANKFTSYGRIVLSVKRLGNTYTFLVADTGEGIEESQLPYIFEPFFQGNKGHTKKYQGTGMGLTISQALVKMMGSEIKVHSEFAKGSQFWFELRLPEEDSSLKSLRNSKNFSFDTLAPKTVLLVDDTPENILLLEVYMKKCPYKIIVAENGIQAVELYKTHQIDVILMDLQMPLMNGYEATAHIRQFERDQRNDNRVLIIACTAYTGKTDVDLAYQCGCDAYLSKPLTWFRLIEMIENLWSNQSISTRVDA